MNPIPTLEQARLDGTSAKPGTDTLVASTDAQIDRASVQGRDALHRLAHQAEDFAHQSAAQLRQRGTAIHDGTLLQIREHPLRSVMLAAGAGVAVTLLIRLLMKR